MTVSNPLNNLFPAQPRQDQGGARDFSQPERRAIDDVIAHHAAGLRACAHLLEGMIEHHSTCDCGENDPTHDALVLVIPEPYLSAYKKHLPDFMTAINLEVEASLLASKE